MTNQEVRVVKLGYTPLDAGDNVKTIKIEAREGFIGLILYIKSRATGASISPTDPDSTYGSYLGRILPEIDITVGNESYIRYGPQDFILANDVLGRFRSNTHFGTSTFPLRNELTNSGLQIPLCPYNVVPPQSIDQVCFSTNNVDNVALRFSCTRMSSGITLEVYGVVVNTEKKFGDYYLHTDIVSGNTGQTISGFSTDPLARTIGYTFNAEVSASNLTIDYSIQGRDVLQEFPASLIGSYTSMVGRAQSDHLGLLTNSGNQVSNTYAAIPLNLNFTYDGGYELPSQDLTYFKFYYADSSNPTDHKVTVTQYQMRGIPQYYMRGQPK